jgi:hypothetical protein
LIAAAVADSDNGGWAFRNDFDSDSDMTLLLCDDPNPLSRSAADFKGEMGRSFPARYQPFFAATSGCGNGAG